MLQYKHCWQGLSGIVPRPAPGHGYVYQALQKLLQTLAVYLQMADEPRLGYITDQLKSLSVSSSGPPQLQVGALCLARYSLDNEWYRAAVQRVISSDPVNPQYAVIFLDFGNTDRVGAKSVRAIDSALAAVPAQAHCCSLAYLKVRGRIVLLNAFPIKHVTSLTILGAVCCLGLR